MTTKTKARRRPGAGVAPGPRPINHDALRASLIAAMAAAPIDPDQIGKDFALIGCAPDFEAQFKRRPDRD